MNTSGSDQASDGDNDDLTKLVATLQSVVDSESKSSKKHSQAVHHTTVVNQQSTSFVWLCLGAHSALNDLCVEVRPHTKYEVCYDVHSLLSDDMK